MKPFSDRLEDVITKNQSILVAGIDPDLEAIPETFFTEAKKSVTSDEELVARVIGDFYISTLERVHNRIGATKPNLAFFEQYGIAGIRAYQMITHWCRTNNLPIIADAKRGDIGSTASAYARAFFRKTPVGQIPVSTLYADALTVNPFLGFDTLDPFIEQAIKSGAGIFVLVRTSNPGSGDLQSVGDGTDDVSSKVAMWLNRHAEKLQGSCGISGLGAVVGATHPRELQRMRELMPQSLFLVPGYGAQGGSAADICAAVANNQRGVVVNSSRGIFGGLAKGLSRDAVCEAVTQRVEEANAGLQCVRKFS